MIGQRPKVATLKPSDSPISKQGSGAIRQSGVPIELRNIRHGFAHGDTVVRAVWDFSLSIESGEFVCLVGPSGCGKTTVLGMVAGMIQPREGSIDLDGEPLRSTRLPDVAYMLARDALLPWRTAQENVELGLQIRNMPKAERRRISADWLRRMGLDGFGGSSVLRLSQGMRQRVAIARTLALSPRCVLMDEPFAALDAQTRLLIQKEFISVWERERPTVIFVTHDLTEAISLGDRIILMSKRPGRIVANMKIDIPRPRNLDEPFVHPSFGDYHNALASQLRAEVTAAEHDAEADAE